MKLASATLLNGLAVVAKVGSQLLVNKLIAVAAGPAGFGLVGQFQSLIAVISLLSSGSLANGVVKYTAQHRDAPAVQRRLWSTALRLVAGLAVVLAGGLLALRPQISDWLFMGHSVPALGWLAVAALPAALSGLLVSILNGMERIGAYVLASVLGSLVTAGWVALMVAERGIAGAFLALATAQALVFLCTACVFTGALGRRWADFLDRFDAGHSRNLGRYALMGLTSAVVIPVSQIAMRNILGTEVGAESVGYWQALTRISETHLMLLTTTLSVYFLPRFARLHDPRALLDAIGRAYRFVIPLVIATAALLYLAREVLIVSLLSDQFLPVADVLAYQLVGDVLKVGSWVMAFTMVSHALSTPYIVSEVAFAGLQVLLTQWLVASLGLLGAPLAYAITYSLYWVFAALMLRGLMRRLGAGAGSTPADR